MRFKYRDDMVAKLIELAAPYVQVRAAIAGSDSLSRFSPMSNGISIFHNLPNPSDQHIVRQQGSSRQIQHTADRIKLLGSEVAIIHGENILGQSEYMRRFSRIKEFKFL